MVNIYFKENKCNKLQLIGINAKQARGSMVNFIAKNFIDIPTKLKEFTGLNYAYDHSVSTDTDWVFIKNA